MLTRRIEGKLRLAVLWSHSHSSACCWWSSRCRRCRQQTTTRRCRQLSTRMKGAAAAAPGLTWSTRIYSQTFPTERYTLTLPWGTNFGPWTLLQILLDWSVFIIHNGLNVHFSKFMIAHLYIVIINFKLFLVQKIATASTLSSQFWTWPTNRFVMALLFFI